MNYRGTPLVKHPSQQFSQAKTSQLSNIYSKSSSSPGTYSNTPIKSLSSSSSRPPTLPSHSFQSATNSGASRFNHSNIYSSSAVDFEMSSPLYVQTSFPSQSPTNINLLPYQHVHSTLSSHTTSQQSPSYSPMSHVSFSPSPPLSSTLS